MVGMGTIANVGLVLVGATVGTMVKGGLKERFQKTILQALGLAVMFIGIGGALKEIFVFADGKLDTSKTMLMIVSLSLGALIGEWINIEKRLEQLGEFCKNKFKVKSGSGGGNFVEGFVTASLLYCVGAMSVVGSLQDGLSGDASMLYAKAVIDGVAAVIFTSTLGTGVFFSAIPLGLYQGAITLSAGAIGPYLSEGLIGNMSFVGSILIFALGINMVFDMKLKVGNMLPAILIPIAYEIGLNLFK